MQANETLTAESHGSLTCVVWFLLPSGVHGRDADELPNVPDWEESARLANEKEVLGFYVSGHPLDKYADKLRNLTNVISIADALERKPPELDHLARSESERETLPRIRG